MDFLNDVDAAMEPDVLKVLQSYLASGGGEETERQREAFVALTSTYRGLAELSNAVAQWLLSTGRVKQQEIEEWIFEEIKRRVIDAYRPHLELAGGQVPQWVDFMTSESRWRRVIYELAERYPECQLMRYCIERIVSSGAHQEELAQQTTQAGSKFFPVYNQALALRISDMIDMTEGQLHAALPAFRSMCVQAPNTYLYAQLLCITCARSDVPAASALMRLVDELEEFATQQHRGSNIAGRIAYSLKGLEQFKGLGAAIVTMLNEGRTNSADVLKIHAAYSGPADERPPLIFLHNATLLSLLVNALFLPSSTRRDHLREHAYCLAVASCGLDDERLLADTCEGLQATSAVCRKNAFGTELTNQQPWLRYYLSRHPAVSMGILRWIESNITDASYYAQGSYTLSLSVFLSLLVDIARTHPLQQGHVTQLMRDAYEVVGADDDESVSRTALLEVKKELLETVVRLMCCGDAVALQTLEWMRHIAALPHTDRSVVRHFLCRALVLVRAPYHSEFAELMLTLFDVCVPSLEQGRDDLPRARLAVTLFEVDGVNVLHRFLDEVRPLTGRQLDLRAHPERIPRPAPRVFKLRSTGPAPAPRPKKKPKKKKPAPKRKPRRRKYDDDDEEEEEDDMEADDDDFEWKPRQKKKHKFVVDDDEEIEYADEEEEAELDDFDEEEEEEDDIPYAEEDELEAPPPLAPAPEPVHRKGLEDLLGAMGEL